MKSMKKVFALLLAVVMVMGLSVTAFAAGTGTYTITINDAVKGETYNAYKIFDATANADKSAYSYTISKTSAWFDDVLLYMGGGTTAATADADTGVYTGAGLTLTPSAADADVYVVTATVLGEGETAVEGTTYFSVADFAAFLNTKTTGKTTNASVKATSTTVTLDVSDSEAGYYFVDTSLGALCSLDTVVGTAQVIYEKNSVPSITKYVLDDDNNSTHVLNTTADWNNWDTDNAYAVLDVIDTVNYKLVVDTGSDTQGDGTGVDANYVIVDTLPTGIVLNGTSNDNYTVVVTTDTGAEGATETWDATDNYTVSYNSTDNKLTITLLATGKLATLAESTTITITYNAKMVADADATTTDVAVNGNNINNVTLSYQSQTSTSQANVKTYQLVNEDENGKPAFTKIDGSTQQVLEGVTFVLSRTQGDATQYAVVTDGYLTGWDTEDKATALVTDSDGSINVLGLDAGTYILTETATLDGYNLLEYTITVVIAADGSVTYQKNDGSNTAASATIQIENNTGSVLPSTGGIGTTIFYVVGSILVIGAAVLLITKKRMNGTAE